MLIASADRLPETAPAGMVVDPHQGFGRTNLAAAAKPSAGVTFTLDQTRKLLTGQTQRSTANVSSSAAPLRIVLAYTTTRAAASSRTSISS